MHACGGTQKGKLPPPPYRGVERKKAASSRESCKEARSPAKSWVSGNTKAKLKENVKDIKGLLATDSEFRGHTGGF